MHEFDACNRRRGSPKLLESEYRFPRREPWPKTHNKLWRIHSASPSERFSFFELTDENGGDRPDRTPVVEGEIRLAIAPDRRSTTCDAAPMRCKDTFTSRPEDAAIRK
jgi:hypothetical protein